MSDTPLIITKNFDNTGFYVFDSSIETLTLKSTDNIHDFFYKLEQYLNSDYWAAGYFSYEAGFCLIDYFKKNIESHIPLALLAIYEHPKEFKDIYDLWNDSGIRKRLAMNSEYMIKNYNINGKYQEYKRAFKRIKRYLEMGYTYQINYSVKYDFKFIGNAFLLFIDLLQRQNTEYCAYIQTKDFNILTLSPELFFKSESSQIFAKPMKGTISRGNSEKEDEINYNYLKHSEKDRAENVMIVDLLRNDLARIAEYSTVKVSDLFNIEKHKTLFQMTSAITAKLKNHVKIYHIFKSLFPCGSVTGAPKIKSMEIINELEKHKRNIFCGAIGYINNEKNALFNVAIRTLLIGKNGKAEFCVGSGIVYDSHSRLEYWECKLKAAFLTEMDFELIETMLYETDAKNIYLLDLHLKRLKKSAKDLNFKYPHKKILKTIKSNLEVLNKENENKKLRLLLSPCGNFNLSIGNVESFNQRINQVGFSDLTINSRNELLKYKTTKRTAYNLELERARHNALYDYIFLNERKEITESTVGNIVIKKNDNYYTPALECGLLPGVMREFLIKSPDKNLQEKILYAEDLKNADEIYIANSVRKMVKVKLV